MLIMLVVILQNFTTRQEVPYPAWPFPIVHRECATQQEVRRNAPCTAGPLPEHLSYELPEPHRSLISP